MMREYICVMHVQKIMLSWFQVDLAQNQLKINKLTAEVNKANSTWNARVNLNQLNCRSNSM